ncbi:hypothetical protein [Cellulomonas sp. C5510]|uniref:hypothetical protein n=1 Tax=Cellulomonas sp. C5510 TaxID=2871170 RepID=UPI001C944E01|nr:hypothetical protein [Cellulomonas sp. C5510]QZN86156.1 hypothetical protein K5O09_02850 [Cellulomonas sp. C5510]
MPTRLLLEGADLAELMVHVREEFGPTARIVRAERVRSGGIAGFFARERYELTIDVPDAAPAPTAGLPRRRGAGQVVAAGGIDALLAAADAGDAAPDGTLVPPPAATSALPEQRTPRVSTGEQAFASVLEQMRAMTGLPPEHHLEVAPEPVPAAERTFEPLGVPGPSQSAPAGPTGAVASAAPSRAEPSGGASTGGASTGAGSGGVGAAADAAAPAASGVSRTVLAELGVPAELLDGDGPVGLSSLLAAVPSAPPLPRAPGTVVVVAGPPADATRVADLLALRTGGTTVVAAGDAEPVGGGRRLTTVTAAQRWRAEHHDAAGVTVVALGVRPGRAREEAAAELLAALAPDQAWGVVDARSKRRDCARWIAAVGGRRPLDALAVGGLFDTSEPGTVLGLGVPVAWIDGVPASRVAWAAALAEHLPEGTAWG